MIKNYDSQENKISIYPNYAVHLHDHSRGRNKKMISHLFFEMGGRTDSITSSLMDTRRNANNFVFIRLCTDGRWDLLFAQHSEDTAEHRSLDTHMHAHTHTHRKWQSQLKCAGFIHSANRSELSPLLLDNMAYPHSQSKPLMWSIFHCLSHVFKQTGKMWC